jgi:diphthine-ammonia ligase
MELQEASGLLPVPAVDPAGRACFVSWSGGKDSCLALHRAVAAGARPVALFTMMTELEDISRSHGLPRWLLESQAGALGLPLVTRAASWADYEAAFDDGLAELACLGARKGIFGDIDIEEHRAWCQQLCQGAGLAAEHPLWQGERRALLEEFLSLGYEAMIVAVRLSCLDRELLGQTLTPDLISRIEARGADACGENGEYHTVVTGGPLLRGRVGARPGAVSEHGGCAFVRLERAPADGGQTAPVRS